VEAARRALLKPVAMACCGDGGAVFAFADMLDLFVH
jgi:hypothetical protein